AKKRGSTPEHLAAVIDQPDADPFDLLCHLAFNVPLHTRRERADRLRKEKRAFFERYGPDARAILEAIVDKYAQYGPNEIVLPDVLKLPPISDHGNASEIARAFGGAQELRRAVDEPQTLLYAA